MTEPKIIHSPSTWHNQDPKPDRWYTSAKEELQQIEREESRKP